MLIVGAVFVGICTIKKNKENNMIDSKKVLYLKGKNYERD